MDYKEAIKRIQTKKTTDSYMIIELGYDSKIVLPHKEGVAIINALNNAEQWVYDRTQHIVPIKMDFIHAKILSTHDYESYKLATLLDITIDEARNLHKG